MEKGGNANSKAEVFEGDLKILVKMLALNIEEEAASQGSSQSQEAGRSKEADSPIEPSEGLQPCQHLHFSPGKLVTSRTTRECICVCSKPPSLWSLVTIAIGNQYSAQEWGER